MNINHLHEGTLSSPPGSPRPLLNKFRYGGVKLYTWEPFYTWSTISTTTIKGIRLVTTERKGNLVPITEYRHDKHEHQCLSRAMHKSDWTACMSAFFPQEMIDRQTRQLSNTVHRIGHWPMVGSTDPNWSITHNIQVRRLLTWSDVTTQRFLSGGADVEIKMANATFFFTPLVLLLIPEHCHDEFFVDFNFFHGELLLYLWTHSYTHIQYADLWK